MPQRPGLEDFLNQKLDDVGQIEFNTADILGYGGESLVVKRTIEQNRPRMAFKIIPYDEIDEEATHIVKEAQRKKNNSKTNSPKTDSTNDGPIMSSPAKRAKLTDHADSGQGEAGHADNVPLFDETDVDPDSLELLENSGEYTGSSIKHENVMDFENIGIDIVHEIVSFVAGKSGPVKIYFFCC